MQQHSFIFLKGVFLKNSRSNLQQWIYKKIMIFQYCLNDSHILAHVLFGNLFLKTNLFIACSKFHLRKYLCYIENSYIIDSVDYLTGFYLILTFLLKKYVRIVFNLLYSIKFFIFLKFNLVPILFL